MYFDQGIELMKLRPVEFKAWLYMRSGNFIDTVQALWSHLGNILHENIWWVVVTKILPPVRYKTSSFDARVCRGDA